MTQPKFIVFEGLDGCGKTTQIAAIDRWLRGEFEPRGLPAPHLTKEPGGTDLGLEIRAKLLDRDEGEIAPLAELLLFQVDRAQHVPVIRERLAQGRWVLCDRYTASTIAYQAYGRGLNSGSAGIVATLNDIASDGLRPDLTIWLDMPPHLAQARRAASGVVDRIDAADPDFHRRVYNGFADQWAESHADDRPWARVDASLPIDAVAHLVQAAIVSAFPAAFPAVRV
jgi:dTMP kinase